MRKLGGDPHGLSIQWPLRGSGDGAGIQPRAIGPAVAGTWYPADPERLRADVDALIQSGSPRERFGGAPILGVIVPHAGFMYSGEVADKPSRGCAVRATSAFCCSAPVTTPTSEAP
jgi:hypothetical protein